MNVFGRMRKVTVAAVTAGIVFGLVACGDDEKTTTGSSGAGEQKAEEARPEAIAATLGEYSIELDRAETSSGPASFSLENVGKIEHEFVIIKTSLAAQSLPHKSGKVEEKGVGEVIAEAEGIKSGTTVPLKADLKPGNYVLICNLPKHYEDGMYTAFKVT